MQFKKNVKMKKYTFHIKHKKTGREEHITTSAESAASALLHLPDDVDIIAMEVI